VQGGSKQLYQKLDYDSLGDYTDNFGLCHVKLLETVNISDSKSLSESWCYFEVKLQIWYLVEKNSGPDLGWRDEGGCGYPILGVNTRLGHLS
jgi:hypothetical protein